MQKYEKGINRISASHLYKFARVLNCTPNDLFEGLQENGGDTNGYELLMTAETVQLFKAFGSLDNRARNAVLELTRSLATAARVRRAEPRATVSI